MFLVFGSQKSAKGKSLASASQRLRLGHFVPRLENLECRTLPSKFTVLNLHDSGPGSLRQAILDANALKGADGITFAADLKGPITLTTGQLDITDDLTVNGPGAEVIAVSGNRTSRVFSISGGVTVTIAGLTIRDGLVVGAPANGAGILNSGSTLTLAHTVLSNNEAYGEPGRVGRGGAIDNVAGATLVIADSLFFQNLAAGGTSSFGNGGAIFNSASTATIGSSTFLANQSTGGSAGAGQGGAIANIQGAALTVSDSLFAQNQAVGGPGDAGVGNGGAILNSGSGLIVRGSTFLGNQVTGNNTTGGAITTNMASTATISFTTFDDNESLARNGGNSGFTRGGAIYVNNATLDIADSSFTGNRAVGGSRLTGTLVQTGLAFGGAIGNADQAILFVARTTFTRNQALGGSHNMRIGGRATLGVGSGGAVFNVGVATVSDSTFEQNEARGGSDNTGDTDHFQSVGSAVGGAIATSAGNFNGEPVVLTLSNARLRSNRAVAGDRNTGGAFMGAHGGGLSGNGSNPIGPSGGSMVTIRNSAIAENEAVGGQEDAGGTGGDAEGGGIANLFGGLLTVSGSTVAGNRAVAHPDSGHSRGGGVFNDGPSEDPSNPGVLARLTVLDTTVAGNEAIGGSGAAVARGAGGGIWSASILTLQHSQFTQNTARGGDGTDGGDGLGGGLFIGGGTTSILDTVFLLNQARGGDSVGEGSGGHGHGGGIYVAEGTVTVSASEITENEALGGHGDVDGEGIGGGVYNLGAFLFDGLTVIAGNQASTSDDDCFGC